MYENIKIESMDDFGRGICFIDKKITFVENALPGEVVDLKITKNKKKYNEAQVLNIRKKSQERRDYSCPYYKECGGCNIAHLSYSKQLEFKKKKVENIVRRFTKYKDIEIKKIHQGEELYYRNKVTLHIQNNKIGYYKQKTNTLIPIEECLLLHDTMNKIIQRMNQYLKKNTLCDMEIIIRSLNQEIILLTSKEVPDDFIKQFHDICLVAKDKCINKNDFIIDELLGNQFIVKKNAFYQVNKKQVEKLYGIVRDFVKKGNYKNALDLYCGTGTIGITISPYVEQVVGIEVNASSVESANENKKMNHISNITFIEGKVEDKIDEIKGQYDLVIVDPPRSGLDKHAISMIKEIHPKDIIYVSCDPMTLARDIDLLSDFYDLKKIELVDMFSNTYHIESVCILVLR